MEQVGDDLFDEGSSSGNITITVTEHYVGGNEEVTKTVKNYLHDFGELAYGPGRLVYLEKEKVNETILERGMIGLMGEMGNIIKYEDLLIPRPLKWVPGTKPKWYPR